MRAGRNLCAQWLGKALNIEHSSDLAAELPLFLCPAFRPTGPAAQQFVRAATVTPSLRRPGLVPPWRRRDGCVPPTRALSSQAANVLTNPAEDACDEQQEPHHQEPHHQEPPAGEPTSPGGPPPPASETRPPCRPSSITTRAPTRTLPIQCSGCGALAQTSLAGHPGHFDLNRHAVQLYLGLPPDAKKEAGRQRGQQKREAENRIFEQALRGLGPEQLKGFLGMMADFDREQPIQTPEPKEPLCDRCHSLVHQFQGDPIAQPTMEALRQTIDESPYKDNHVYHVIDAADFPMSLVPRIHQLLDLAPMRSRNRRAKHTSFSKGRRMNMSFIIARSDLLAPHKLMVDSIQPYLREVLRDALGRAGNLVRLGNVYCVSAKVSWWCRELREDIFERGGAGWMVGKANVGKSQLFEAVFPKGRLGSAAPKTLISGPPSVVMDPEVGTLPPEETAMQQREEDDSPARFLAPVPESEELDEHGLLPPAPAETNFPKMPLVSAIPGTTASPIRIPFGNAKGELIDLPGLHRTDLHTYVKDVFRGSLLMEERLAPTRQVLRPGQSLLLGGGLVRITPRLDENSPYSSLCVISSNFTRLDEHITATAKAIAAQEEHEERPNLPSIVLPGTGSKMKHAGAFPVRYDVTKYMLGPVTSKEGADVDVERLPFRALSIDLLIEGCGWVEIVAQVRLRHMYPNMKPRRPRPKPAAPSADAELGPGEAGGGDADPSSAFMQNTTEATAAGADFSTWPDVRPGETYEDYDAPQHVPFNDEIWDWLDKGSGGDDRAMLDKIGHWEPVPIGQTTHPKLIRPWGNDHGGDANAAGPRHKDVDVHARDAPREPSKDFGDDTSRLASLFPSRNGQELEAARGDTWREQHQQQHQQPFDPEPEPEPEPERKPECGPVLPIIDVFTPEGRFVAARRPMCAWSRNRRLKRATKPRPRPSMKGVKKERKRMARQKDTERGAAAAHVGRETEPRRLSKPEA